MAREDENKILWELGIDGIIGIILFLAPFGAEQMRMPPNFWLGLLCWIVALGLAIRMFWIFPYWVPNRTALERSLIAFIITGVTVMFAYAPVRNPFQRGTTAKIKLPFSSLQLYPRPGPYYRLLRRPHRLLRRTPILRGVRGKLKVNL